MPSRAVKIQIPRWIQLVGLPLLLVLAWVVAGAVRHVVFLFLVAALIALLLSLPVRVLTRIRIRRGFAVFVVYLAFLAAVVAAIAAVGTVVVSETKTAATRVNDYFTVPHGRRHEVDADRDVDRFQHWLDTHHLRVQVRDRGHKLVAQIRDKNVGKYTHRAVNFVEGAAISIGTFLFDTVIVIVVSVYMLLDLPRLGRVLDRRFSPRGSPPLLSRMEWAIASYVKGQLLLSLIIGASAGFGLWIFGVTGLLPGAAKYALLFGAWVAIMELIPYIGPWLGAIPPFVYAVFTHPIGALWVTLLFLFIHQAEGHVVVPNVMGSALRLHPLLVIFGLLAGGEIYGLPGVLVALPLLAAGRAIWEFFAERVELEAWAPGAGEAEIAVPVEVEPPGEPVGPFAD